jgi:hypothetical protein
VAATREKIQQMITTVDTPCDCFRASPWPAMLCLYIDRAARRYYLCPRCGTVREDVARLDGSTAVAHFYRPESGNLPTAVAKRAREILARPDYRQLSLFDD